MILISPESICESILFIQAVALCVVEINIIKLVWKRYNNPSAPHHNEAISNSPYSWA